MYHLFDSRKSMMHFYLLEFYRMQLLSSIGVNQEQVPQISRLLNLVYSHNVTVFAGPLPG